MKILCFDITVKYVGFNFKFLSRATRGEIKRLIQHSERIEAVKLYRKETGVDFYHGKQYVQRMERKLSAECEFCHDVQIAQVCHRCGKALCTECASPNYRFCESCYREQS